MLKFGDGHLPNSVERVALKSWVTLVAIATGADLGKYVFDWGLHTLLVG